MKVLLTGSTGFIGHHLAKWLLLNGCEVIALGRHSSSLDGVINIKVSDFCEKNIITALQHVKFDALVHLAAAGVTPSERDSHELIEINSLLPALLVKVSAQAGAKAAVLVGSCAEYKATSSNRPLLEDAPLETYKLYGATKAAGGILAIAQGQTYEIPVGVIRLFNVFGYGEAPHRLLPSLVTGLMADRPVKLSEGSQIRDFVYVIDVCRGLHMCLAAFVTGSMNSGAYNLATGIGHSVADFCKMVASILQKDEALLEFGSLSLRPDDLPYVVGSAVSLEEACGWRPEYTFLSGLQEAIAKMMALKTKINL